MDLKNNTVLITGGSSGIGFSLAKAFLKEGCRVIICGRRKDKLEEAKEKHPQLHIKVCDVADEAERESLFSWVEENFSSLDILVNNAGIQRDIDFARGAAELSSGESEIRTNIEGPVYLSGRFIPLLKRQGEAAIINVSSVLAFAPMARVPVYCATKAFIHNFSLSLRFQLQETGIKVFEIIPPRVKTELNREGREKMGYAESGIDADDFVSTVMEGLAGDEYEIEYDDENGFRRASRDELDEKFDSINGKRYDWN